MKRFLLLITIFTLSYGCTVDSVHDGSDSLYEQDEIDPAMIIGSWISRMEGSCEWTYVFDDDGLCTYEYTYLDEWFWGDKETIEYDYAVTDGILTLNSRFGGDPVSYKIVKLNESIMEWEWQQIDPNTSDNKLITYNRIFKRIKL